MFILGGEGHQGQPHLVFAKAHQSGSGLDGNGIDLGKEGVDEGQGGQIQLCRFLQGLVGGVANIVTTAIIGTLLCIAYAATKPKTGSLKEEE